MMNGIISTNNLVNTPATLETFGSVTIAHGGAMMFGILTHKISGIYQIVNTINGHCYIGSSVDINKRWSTHKQRLHKGTHDSPYLQNAWNKYGESCFRFSIIEQCDSPLLIEREQYYIDTLRPIYNTATKAGSRLGIRHTEEARRKISEAGKGRVMSPEARKKIADAHRGVPILESVLRKLTEARRAMIISDEQKRKMSEARKGRKATPETRAKLSEIQRNMSSDIKTKISQTLKGHSVSEETRQKISNTLKAKNAKDIE